LNILYESHSLAQGALVQSFIAASEPSNNTLTGLKSIQNGFHKKSRDDFVLL